MLKRLSQSALLIAVALTMLGAGTPATRFDQIGHKLMCTCGCAELLLECNHVGCPDSPGLIAELHTQVDSGATDNAIFQSFAAKYGPTVLAAPLRGGFDDVAWVVPFAVLGLGIAAIVLLLRLWTARRARLAPSAPVPATPAADALRDRIRQETGEGREWQD
jgi:cytochrome c-type biogenesis protein CcmH